MDPGRAFRLLVFSFFLVSLAGSSPGAPPAAGATTLGENDPLPDIVVETPDANPAEEALLTLVRTRPDLVVKDLTVPPTAVSGKETVVTATVGNLGPEPAGPFRARLQYGIDHVDAPVGGVDPQSEVTVSWTVTFERGTTPLEAVADIDEEIEEDVESNNGVESSLDLFPDVAVSALTWSPASPPVGSDVTFTAVLHNRGRAPMEPFDARFTVGDGPADTLTVDRILPGAGRTVQWIWVAQAGTHAVEATLDDPDANPENDGKTASITIASLPNLQVSDLSWSPASPVAGDSVTFTATVKNAGEGGAPASRVALLAGGLSLGSRDVAALAAGATATASWTWAAVEGEHALKAFADAGTDAAEALENDNEITRTLTVAASGSGEALPDLTVRTVTFSPTDPAAGDAVTVQAKLANAGDAPAGASKARLGVDGEALEAKNVPALSPGADATVTWSWKATAGDHVFSVEADALNALEEAGKGNNVKRVGLSVAAPSAADAPDSGTKGTGTNAGSRTESGSGGASLDERARETLDDATDARPRGSAVGVASGKPAVAIESVEFVRYGVSLKVRASLVNGGDAEFPGGTLTFHLGSDEVGSVTVPALPAGGEAAFESRPSLSPEMAGEILAKVDLTQKGKIVASREEHLPVSVSKTLPLAVAPGAAATLAIAALFGRSRRNA